MSKVEHINELKAFIFSEIRKGGALATDEELDHLMFQTPGTLRLRKAGCVLLAKIYDAEDFPLDKALTGRELMTLKQYVSWPYFLPQNHSHLMLFIASKDAFYLKLQGGDIKKWLAQLYDKNRQQLETA